MKRLRFLFQIYAMVMTSVTFAVAVFTTIISPAEMIETKLLWQMILVSGLCTLTSLIYPWNREMGKVEMIVKTVIHYILINVIVLGSGALFYWYDPTQIYSIMTMVFTIAVIFGSITAGSWKKAALDAARMNERLEEYQRRTEQDSKAANDLQNFC